MKFVGRIRPLFRSTSSRRWGRRFFMSTSLMAVGYLCVDYSTANSLTRSLSTMKTVARIVYLYKTVSPTTPEEYSNLHRTAAEALLKLCLRNEGLYIKFGQGLNALNHILPQEYMDVLKVLLDNAPLVSLTDVKRIIKEETGKDVEELFSYFDPLPVASASIAQVHRARLLAPSVDGGSVEVAVKVQKPNIRRQVFWDLETYRLVTWAIGVLFDLPMGWAQKNFMEGIRREVDFSIEAGNATRMRRDFAAYENVYVPKVYEELVTPCMLVLEWIDAVKLIDVEDIRWHFDEVAVLRTIFDAFGDMIFKHGFTHCDPHAANILVRPPPCKLRRESSRRAPQRCMNPQIVLLDFGLCCSETLHFRMEYALLFKSIVLRDINTVRDIATSWGITDAEMFASIQFQKPYEALRRGDYSEVTREEVQQIQISAYQRAKTLLRNQEKLPPELPLVGRSIDILRGLNRLYGAPLNRVNMFVRRAVAALGPLNSYADIQRFLAQFDTSYSMIGRSSSAASVGWHVSDSAVNQARLERDSVASSPHPLCGFFFYRQMREFFVSKFRQLMFELVLFLLDARHVLVCWYNKVIDACLPNTTAASLHGEMLEDVLERQQIEFFSARCSPHATG